MGEVGRGAGDLGSLLEAHGSLMVSVTLLRGTTGV